MLVDPTVLPESYEDTNCSYSLNNDTLDLLRVNLTLKGSVLDNQSRDPHCLYSVPPEKVTPTPIFPVK